jgi:poly-beta-1,6-N-acetyl-D-glucosamine synthase
MGSPPHHALPTAGTTGPIRPRNAPVAATAAVRPAPVVDGRFLRSTRLATVPLVRGRCLGGLLAREQASTLMDRRWLAGTPRGSDVIEDSMSGSSILLATLLVPVLLLLFVGSAWLYGYLNATKVLAGSDRKLRTFAPIDDTRRVAVLIACHNGAATVAATVKAAAANGCDVYVVSDASSDRTVAYARQSGATAVLELTTNVGKPAALHRGYEHFGLSDRYEAVAILDDDVVIDRRFIAESLRLLRDDVVIVVGKNLTWWPPERRWNALLAKRTYSYWNYQLIIRRLQSAFGVMNCISGSNSVYRTELLDAILPVQPPYIVDDTFWVLETQRRELGSIVYAPRARAVLQDPTNLRDWYRQNLRWLWGTFQGIIGHRVGRTYSRFDVAYVLLMLQWVLYIVSGPVALWLIVASRAPHILLIFLGGYAAWVLAASIHLRIPRLVLFLPAIMMLDLLYRVIFVHALIKAVRQPTVDRCVWSSPARLATEPQEVTAT